MSGIQMNTTAIDLPSEVASTIIQKAQEESTVMRLAQSIALPGNGLTIPVILGDPEAEWVEETNEKPVSTATLDKKVIKPYTLAVIVPFSNQFKNNMAGLYNAIVSRLPKVLSQKFDATVFGNTPVPGSNFDTFASCTAQSFGSDPYTAFVQADADISAHDGITNGHIISPIAKSQLLLAKDNDGRPLFINSIADNAIPKILGSETYQSKAAFKSVPGGKDIIGVTGDWTKAMYGIAQNLALSVSDQATLTVGSETINLWQRNMFAVRAEIEVGFAADTSVFNLLTE